LIVDGTVFQLAKAFAEAPYELLERLDLSPDLEEIAISGHERVVVKQGRHSEASD